MMYPGRPSGFWRSWHSKATKYMETKNDCREKAIQAGIGRLRRDRQHDRARPERRWARGGRVLRQVRFRRALCGPYSEPRVESRRRLGALEPGTGGRGGFDLQRDAGLRLAGECGSIRALLDEPTRV